MASKMVSKLHSKNSFSLAIFLGDFFSNPEVSSDKDDANVSDLINGKITIPLPTYFTLGKHPLPGSVIEKLEQSDDELCPNLYFLGKRSTTKTSEGIRIVNLGGSLDPSITAGLSKEKFLPFHTEDDAKALRGANSADILLTAHWPSDLRKGSKVVLPDGVETPRGERCVSDLCSALRPRYHFSTSSDAFYEREPFFHPPTEKEPEAKPITRFLTHPHPSPSLQAPPHPLSPPLENANGSPAKSNPTHASPPTKMATITAPTSVPATTTAPDHPLRAPKTASSASPIQL
ncbi:MAG: hypothetical protein Q9216_006435 [Gyalolechia sp. 2 TL-2023]